MCRSAISRYYGKILNVSVYWISHGRLSSMSLMTMPNRVTLLKRGLKNSQRYASITETMKPRKGNESALPPSPSNFFFYMKGRLAKGKNINKKSANVAPQKKIV